MAKGAVPTIEDLRKYIDQAKESLEMPPTWKPQGQWHRIHGDGKTTTKGMYRTMTCRESGTGWYLVRTFWVYGKRETSVFGSILVDSPAELPEFFVAMEKGYNLAKTFGISLVPQAEIDKTNARPSA